MRLPAVFCKRGHILGGSNIYWVKSGRDCKKRARCRTCANYNCLISNRKRRHATPPSPIGRPRATTLPLPPPPTPAKDIEALVAGQRRLLTRINAGREARGEPLIGLADAIVITLARRREWQEILNEAEA